MASASCCARTARAHTDRSASIADIAEIVVCLAGCLDNITGRTAKPIPSLRGDSLALAVPTRNPQLYLPGATISEGPLRGEHRRSGGEAPASPTWGDPIVELDRAIRPRTESNPAHETCFSGDDDQEGGSVVAIGVVPSPQPILHDPSVPLGWCIRRDRKPASLETPEHVSVLRDAGHVGDRRKSERDHAIGERSLGWRQRGLHSLMMLRRTREDYRVVAIVVGCRSGYGTTKAPGRFSGVPSAGEVFTTDLRQETRL